MDNGYKLFPKYPNCGLPSRALSVPSLYGVVPPVSSLTVDHFLQVKRDNWDSLHTLSTNANASF
jgi:hypothetical protein